VELAIPTSHRPRLEPSGSRRARKVPVAGMEVALVSARLAQPPAERCADACVAAQPLPPDNVTIRMGELFAGRSIRGRDVEGNLVRDELLPPNVRARELLAVLESQHVGQIGIGIRECFVVVGVVGCRLVPARPWTEGFDTELLQHLLVVGCGCRSRSDWRPGQQSEVRVPWQAAVMVQRPASLRSADSSYSP